MAANAEWARLEGIEWVQLLLDSFRLWTGRELIERTGSRDRQARDLFCAPFVVVSHNAQMDPILNYGNRVALDLWEMAWDEFCHTPSRLTAEPVNQGERARMLADAQARGHIIDYCGVRISKTGRRFLVEHALVWNVVDVGRQTIGQAATFSRWKRLD